MVIRCNKKCKHFFFLWFVTFYFITATSQPYKTESSYKAFLLQNIENTDFIEGIWQVKYGVKAGAKNARGEQVIQPMNIETEPSRLAIIKSPLSGYYCYPVSEYTGDIGTKSPIWEILFFELSAIDGQYLYTLYSKDVNGHGKAYLNREGDLFFECQEERTSSVLNTITDWNYLSLTGTKVAPTQGEIRAFKLQAKAKKEEELKPKFSYGSGIAICNNEILTCYHVVKNAKQISARGINGDFENTRSCKVKFYDEDLDVAVLELEQGNANSVSLLPYSIKRGSSVVGENTFVLGYPLQNTMGKEIKLTTGVISSNSGFLGDTSLYQISAPIQPGNSGGPLFDFAGNLIGIVSAKHNHADNVGYAVKFTLIKKLLQQQGIHCTSNKALLGDLPSKVNQLKSSVYSIEVALK